MRRIFCLIFVFGLLAVGCHGPIDHKAEIRLINGNTISCPAGIELYSGTVYCHQVERGDHKAISIPRSTVAGIVMDFIPKQQ